MLYNDHYVLVVDRALYLHALRTPRQLTYMTLQSMSNQTKVSYMSQEDERLLLV